MAIRLLIVLLITASIAGCASWRSRKSAAAAPQPVANTADVPAQAAPPAASQSSSYMQIPGSYAVGGVSPMESNRTVNEQDCTKEINLQAGNLKCR